MTDDPIAVLRRLVIAWDSEQDEEFEEALTTARVLTGLKLADDAEDRLAELQREHMDADLDDESERT
jgi:hypothetical protein